MKTRRVILISLIVAVIAVCVAWVVYKILPHSVNVTLTGIKYKLSSDGAKADAEQATVVIHTSYVGGQEDIPIESRYFIGFFILSVQVHGPIRGHELVPIAVKDKNMF
ncbi:MAG: hypothetical protein ACQEXX_24660 [Bacillota bacterium]